MHVHLQILIKLTQWFPDLLQYNSMPVEFLCSIGNMLNLGGNREAKSQQLPDLPQKRYQPVTIVHPHFPVLLSELH